MSGRIVRYRIWDIVGPERIIGETNRKRQCRIVKHGVIIVDIGYLSSDGVRPVLLGKIPNFGVFARPCVRLAKSHKHRKSIFEFFCHH